MKPNAPNVGHSVFDERFFHHHRANQGVHVGVIVRRSPGRGAEVDRIVAKVNGLHFEHRLLLFSRTVVSGELAERPFASKLIRRAKTFYSKLTVGWNRQPGHLRINHRHGLSQQGAQVSVFRDAIRNADSTDDEINGMMTKGYR